MAWEERNGRRYYYRKRRVDGQVVSEYIGQGHLVELFARCDELERHTKTIARRDRINFHQEFRRIDQSIEKYRRLVRNIVAAALIGAGYHEHRGQWRMARTMSKKVTKPHPAMAEVAEYYRLYGEAKGDSKVLPQLKAFANEHPGVFDKATLLGVTTLASVLTTMKISDVASITISGEVDAVRRNLGYGKATQLEKLLIEDVVICWLRMQLMEQVYSQNVAPDQYDIAKVDHLERRLSATRRRYLRSVESLARVRGLLSRVGLQINVANQQVVANG